MNSVFNDIGRQQTQQSYMDLHGLQDIRKTGAKDKEAGLRQVAQQFESMFLQMMLKSMRSANDVFAKDNPLKSFESDYYRDMYDNQLSVSLSSNNLGIADAFYRQLKRNYITDTQSSNDTGERGQDVNASSVDQSVNTLLRSPQYTPFNGYIPTLRDLNAPVSTPSSLIPQRINDAKILKNIESPEDFIQAITPYAKKAADTLGVDHRVLIAQSALETGWGEHIIRDQRGDQSFNLFNIKADKRWGGASVVVPTLEYVKGIAQQEHASFRRYGSIEESFNDYQQFLQQPRYQKALKVSHDPHQFIEELHKAGYATDPEYSQKISRILERQL